MVKLAKACFTPFDFSKGKTGNLVVPAQSYNQCLDQFTQCQEQKKLLYSCIVDCDWRKSRLPWLDRVLLYLVEFGLKRVSWAVRYLDEPRWRAVAPLGSGTKRIQHSECSVYCLMFHACPSVILLLCIWEAVATSLNPYIIQEFTGCWPMYNLHLL